MTTIDDKLKLFSKIIYEKIEDKNSKAYKDFQKEKEAKLEALKSYMEVEREKALEDASKKAEMKAHELVILERAKGQKNILFLKQELVEELVKKVKQRFVSFTKDSEYKKYLLQVLRVCAKNLEVGEYNIYLMKDDIERYTKDIVDIFKEKDINIVACQGNYDFIGGFIIQHRDGRYRLDYSFLSKIERSRELIGLKYTHSEGSN
jgi:V/A-type H+-transporting ATPase subunit E